MSQLTNTNTQAIVALSVMIIVALVVAGGVYVYGGPADTSFTPPSSSCERENDKGHMVAMSYAEEGISDDVYRSLLEDEPGVRQQFLDLHPGPIDPSIMKDMSGPDKEFFDSTRDHASKTREMAGERIMPQTDSLTPQEQGQNLLRAPVYNARGEQRDQLEVCAFMNPN